ncbi:class I SAM-dependent methyltransferase [Synechococcus sp. Nb3U1]|uniref:class I SAM-dependent methyltransferase n=1 Tax=Synechococcus sp. Nb3U1 TaxID=1914529 RepID=UPI002E1FE191
MVLEIARRFLLVPMIASNVATPTLTSRLVNGLLSIKPLFNWAKGQARTLMIKRAADIGVDWFGRVQALMAQDLATELAAIENPELVYPDYYLRPFHAYDAGNLSWEAATEVEVAAYAVHARIWPDAGPQGDPRLRQSYHQVLQARIPTPPQRILDLGCSVGMSTFALQDLYPEAEVLGLDLSPYFLAIGNIRAKEQQRQVQWIHAPAESSGLPTASLDLVSACLLFHELPQSAARQILTEARRLLKPGGYFALMDMNPASPVYAQMSPAILTLLKSTEPYLDQYFSLDMAETLEQAGFENITLQPNTPRHRVVVAQAC